MNGIHPTACEAVPLRGHGHDGQVRPYVRICPDGHLRHGTACDSCAGNRAITCARCGDEKPAILIPAATWPLLIAVDLDIDAAASAVGAAMITRQGPREIALAALRAAALPRQAGRELTAEGAGPLLDPACRDGDCGPCPGAPCEHHCHTKENADA